MITVNCAEFVPIHGTDEFEERNTLFKINKDVALLSITFSNMLGDLTDPDDPDSIFKEEVPMILNEGGTCQNSIDLFELVTAMYNNNQATIDKYVNMWKENPSLIYGFMLVNNYVDISYTQYFTESGVVVTDYNKDTVKYKDPKVKDLMQYFMSIIGTVMEQAIQAKNSGGNPVYNDTMLRALLGIPEASAPTKEDENQFFIENERQVKIANMGDEAGEIFDDLVSEFNDATTRYNEISRQLGSSNIADKNIRIQKAGEAAVILSNLAPIMDMIKSNNIDFEISNDVINSNQIGILDNVNKLVPLMLINTTNQEQINLLLKSIEQLKITLEEKDGISVHIQFDNRKKTVDEATKQLEEIKKSFDMISNKIEEVYVLLDEAKLPEQTETVGTNNTDNLDQL